MAEGNNYDYSASNQANGHNNYFYQDYSRAQGSNYNSGYTNEVQGNNYYNGAAVNNNDAGYNQGGGNDYYNGGQGGGQNGYYTDYYAGGNNNYDQAYDQAGGGSEASGNFGNNNNNEFAVSNSAIYSTNNTKVFQQATIVYLSILLVLLFPAVRLVQRFRKSRKQAKQDRELLEDYVAPKFPVETIMCTDGRRNSFGSPGSNGERNSFGLRWSELPKSAKTAAMDLGYDQTRWDRAEIPEHLSDVCWDDLSQTQKDALLQLGTSKEDWNDITKNGKAVKFEASGSSKRKVGFFGRRTRQRGEATKLRAPAKAKFRPKPRGHRPVRKLGRFFKMKRNKESEKGEGNKDPAERQGSQPEMDAEFQDEPLDGEEARMSAPLLSGRRACLGCASFVDGPGEMTDLLDDVNVGDELEEIGPRLDETGAADETVPIYEASILHIGLLGRRNVLLGRNSRGIATTTKSDIDASPLLDDSLVDSADDHIKSSIFSGSTSSDGVSLLDDEFDLPYYDNYDWSELPRAAQTAATTLGYDKKMWNKGKDPEKLRTLSWSGLTITQQAAALELGWDKRRWDGTSEDGKVVDREESLLSHVRAEVNGGWKMASTVLAFDSRSKRLLKLALPASIANCVSPVLDGIMTAVFVTYMGPSKYLAWVMVDFFLGLCDTIVHGVSEAEGILATQAIGMKKYFLAGQYVQLSVVLYAIVAIPAYGCWVFFIGDVMRRFDFGDEVATHASVFIPFSAGARLVEGCFGEALAGLMWNEERGLAMTAIGLVSSVFYTVAFMAMIFVFGSASLITLGAIDLAFALTYSFAVYVICKHKGWLQKYERGLFGNLAISNRALTFGVLKMAAPLTLGHLMLGIEWQILTFFAAHMGAAETAAWSIMASLWGILEEFPSGVHHGAEILVGRYLGFGRPDLAKIVAYKTLLYSMLIAVVSTGIFAYFKELIVFYFTEEEDIFYPVLDLVTLLCISNVAMVIGNAGYSILETQGRTKVPVAIYGFSMMCITIPLSTWFVFGKNLGLESIMMASICGYSTSSFLMLVVVFTTNWPKMSRKSILKASKYDKNSKYEKSSTYVNIAEENESVELGC